MPYLRGKRKMFCQTLVSFTLRCQLTRSIYPINPIQKPCNKSCLYDGYYLKVLLKRCHREADATQAEPPFTFFRNAVQYNSTGKYNLLNQQSTESTSLECSLKKSSILKKGIYCWSVLDEALCAPINR